MTHYIWDRRQSKLIVKEVAGAYTSISMQMRWLEQYLRDDKPHAWLVACYISQEVLGWPMTDAAVDLLARRMDHEWTRKNGFWDEQEIRGLLEDVRLEMGLSDLREVRRGIL